MNILLFIITLILTMGILSFTQLQTHLTQSLLRKEFTCLLQQTAVEPYNAAVTKAYKKKHESSSAQKNGDNPIPIDASRKLNFGYIVQPDLRDKNPVRFETIRSILLQLIEDIYSETPFYQELKEHYAHPGETLINHLIAITNNQPIKNNHALETLDLRDERLQEFLAKLFARRDVDAALEHCHPNEGFTFTPSLWEFVKVESKDRPLRMQLTRPEILYAIFKSPETVKEFLRKMHEFKAEYEKDKSRQEVLTNELRSQFYSSLPSQYDPEYFHFGITTTR